MNLSEKQKKKDEWRKEYYRKNKARLQQYIKDWRSKGNNKVKLAERSKRWKIENLERHRKSTFKSCIKRKYGISMPEYNKLLILQNNRCALCFELFTAKKVLDHDHKTGKIRGFIHPKCNILLGMSCDNTLRLHQAIAYLNKHSHKN